MSEKESNAKIKITKNGPYLVSGNIPIHEKIINPNGHTYKLIEGRKLPQAENYALCRCGKSKNPPFCDGSHLIEPFNGKETASREPYTDRSELLEGPGVDLLDDGRCAFARFCHRKNGTTWDYVQNSNTEEAIREAIQAAGECPSGRLTAVTKEGELSEPDYDPEIDIVEDPERGVSAGIFVKGKIPIESEDGEIYELRNRVALCRCGHSRNKPFCDASHVPFGFSDGHVPE